MVWSQNYLIWKILHEEMDQAEVEPETDDEGNEKKATVKYVTETMTDASHDLVGNFVALNKKKKLSTKDLKQLEGSIPEKTLHEASNFRACRTYL